MTLDAPVVLRDDIACKGGDDIAERDVFCVICFV